MIAEKAAALAVDAGMCALMYSIQRRHRLNEESHFGYRMMPAVWARLVERGAI